MKVFINKQLNYKVICFLFYKLRLERNQEREKSISNMEYLKNIILKFLTFSSPQEKAQLMPVLTTMLKLSQEEQNAIMNAKGSLDFKLLNDLLNDLNVIYYVFKFTPILKMEAQQAVAIIIMNILLFRIWLVVGRIIYQNGLNFIF